MAYSWLPPKKDKDFTHPASSFSKTGLRPNEFHISPEWISEDMHPMTAMGRRRFRPWAYEFQGARHYPYGSVEQKVAEETATRSLLEEDPIPQEERPVTPAERDTCLPRIPLYVSETKNTWGAQAAAATPSAPNRSPSHPHNVFSRHMTDYMTAGKAEVNGGAGDNGGGKYDPIVYQSPQDRSMMISKSASFQPRDGRPRFDRPYLNFANSMWMAYPPDVMATY